jgi:carotenoid cleavage dioxygenase-like enzyme
MANDVVDVASIPQLNGLFAPIQDELTDGPCLVAQGAIPDDLTGAYVRNGPNPRVPPLGPTPTPSTATVRARTPRAAAARPR